VGIVRHPFEREFAAHGFEQCVIQTTRKSEEAICDASLTTQQGSYCCQYGIESRNRLHRTCWSSRYPDQTTARIAVHLRVGIQDGVLQIHERRVIQGKLPLKSVGGDPFVLLEPCNSLR
jgi:hypothetical protein